jgi:hypothetical protein
MSLADAFNTALQSSGITNATPSAPVLDAQGVPTLGNVVSGNQVTLEEAMKEYKEAEGNAPGASVQIDMDAPDY